MFSFNRRGFDDFAGKNIEARFGAQVEPERFHFAQQPALFVANRGEWGGKGGVVPGEVRPMRIFMDIVHFLPQILR